MKIGQNKVGRSQKNKSKSWCILFIQLPSTKYALRSLQSKVTGHREYISQGDTAHREQGLHSAMLLTGNWAGVSGTREYNHYMCGQLGSANQGEQLDLQAPIRRSSAQPITGSPGPDLKQALHHPIWETQMRLGLGCYAMAMQNEFLRTLSLYRRVFGQIYWINISNSIISGFQVTGRVLSHSHKQSFSDA